MDGAISLRQTPTPKQQHRSPLHLPTATRPEYCAGCFTGDAGYVTLWSDCPVRGTNR